MKSVSHSEARWALLPHMIQCNGHLVNGGRCRREAEPGSVVCRLHGGAAPQVRRRAGERLIMGADHAPQKLLEWLDDPEVPYRVRAEIARDMLDRAGLAAAQLHKIVPIHADPVLAFFDGILEQDGLTAAAAALEDPRIRSKITNAEPQPAGRKDLQPRADAMEIRPADQHPVAQADGRLGQHLVVPNKPHAVSPVSRLHRRSLTCPAPDWSRQTHRPHVRLPPHHACRAAMARSWPYGASETTWWGSWDGNAGRRLLIFDQRADIRLPPELRDSEGSRLSIALLR
jgi:hypothetical protein